MRQASGGSLRRCRPASHCFRRLRRRWKIGPRSKPFTRRNAHAEAPRRRSRRTHARCRRPRSRPTTRKPGTQVWARAANPPAQIRQQPSAWRISSAAAVRSAACASLSFFSVCAGDVGQERLQRVARSSGVAGKRREGLAELAVQRGGLPLGEAESGHLCLEVGDQLRGRSGNPQETVQVALAPALAPHATDVEPFPSRPCAQSCPETAYQPRGSSREKPWIKRSKRKGSCPRTEAPPRRRSVPPRRTPSRSPARRSQWD